MPRIPTYTAGSDAQAVQFGQVPGAPPQGADLGQPLRQVGSQGAEIAGRLDRQDAELAVVEAAGRYDGAIKALKDSVFQPSIGPNGEQIPAPANPQAEFVRRGQELQKATLDGIDRPDVKTALQAHINKHFPTQVTEVHFDQLKVMANQQLARLDLIGEGYAKMAAEAPNPSTAAEAVKVYQDTVDRMVGRRMLTPLEGQQKKRIFTETVGEKNMEYKMRTNRPELYELWRGGAYAALDQNKVLKIIDMAQTKDRQDLVEAEAKFHVAQKAVHGVDEADANYGTMTDARLNEIASGKDPYYPDPGKARQLKEVNEKAPFAGGKNPEVGAILAEFYGGRNTVARAAKAQESLNHLLKDADRQQPEVIKALKEMQTHISSAESAARGERSTAAAEKNANIAAGVREYEGTKPPAPGFQPSMIKQGQKNRDEADKAEVRRRAGNGEDGKKVAEEITKRNQQKREAVPPARKSMQEALQ